MATMKYSRSSRDKMWSDKATENEAGTRHMNFIVTAYRERAMREG